MTQLDRLFRKFQAAAQDRAVRAAALPKTRDCPKHGPGAAKLDLETAERGYYGQDCPGLYVCRHCEAEKAEAALRSRLAEAGVPDELLSASLENWKPKSAAQTKHLARVQEFLGLDRGFLVLLGLTGVGKSHLAVGVARDALRRGRSVLYWRQAALVRAVRATYGDSGAEDLVGACLDTDLLVLDDLGASAAGADVVPLLCELIDGRFCDRNRLAITSNLNYADLKSYLGARIADRFTAAAFAVLEFAGQSNRSDSRAKYFEGR